MAFFYAKNKTGKIYCTTAVLKYIVIITSEPVAMRKYLFKMQIMLWFFVKGLFSVHCIIELNRFDCKWN